MTDQCGDAKGERPVRFRRVRLTVVEMRGGHGNRRTVAPWPRGIRERWVRVLDGRSLSLRRRPEVDGTANRGSQERSVRVTHSSAGKRYLAGGTLYARAAGKVLLHLRDEGIKFNPGKWSIFGGW